MATITTFDARVAARTRAALEILGNKELFALYQGAGGLKDDLDAIVAAGRKAEALSHAKSGQKALSESATLDVLSAYTALQQEYVAIMAVVQAACFDLKREGASLDVRQALDAVLKNEAPVVYRPADSAADGTPTKRRAVRSASQESLRAEIHKDAVALLALSGAQAALKKRGVTAARLTALRDAAQALSAHLSSRATQKGASQGVTAAIRAAVREQKAVWGACYRLLDAAAQKDSRLRQLLKDARASR